MPLYRLDGIKMHTVDETGHHVALGKGMPGAHPDGDLVELTDVQAYGLREHLRTPEGHKISPEKIPMPIHIDEDIDIDR